YPLVTGVQTCALPIFEAGTREIKIFNSSSNPAIAQQVLTDMTFAFTADNHYTFIHMGFARTGQTPAREVRVIPDNGADPGALNEIGRASGRERMEHGV